MNEKGMGKVFHYELPNETGKYYVRTFCGKIVSPRELAYSQEEVNCLICAKELEKHNNSKENI